ncbi:hypothetical protein B0H63DRAFT_459553 [Podospora didyma]|uniref:F-box domain-containing protein n=1 Tax=Podospora didyma TaxID=330526 RepID=A0AAE0P5X1_9PEZI|nr:hypothetical protein B0H63DRAFT_459553 [Podospora didyma]
MELLNLPTEILSDIVKILDRTHGPSVWKFAQASRRCYSVAGGGDALKFRTISFHVISLSWLKQDIQTCTELLRETNAFSHVRRFVVFGKVQGPLGSGYFKRAAKVPYRPSPGWQPGLSARTWHTKRMMLHGTTDLPVPQLEEQDEFPQRAFMESTSHDKLDQDWRPLAELIESLPALADLIYQCSFQLPPCVLQALQKKPGCRLHLYTFALRSFTDKEITDLDPHDRALLSSPNLHSIWLIQRGIEGRTHRDTGARCVELPAVIRRVLQRGMAPNLTDLRVHCGDPDDTLSYSGFPDPVVYHHQQKLDAIGSATACPTSLRVLELKNLFHIQTSSREMPVGNLSIWSTPSTGYSSLKTLRLSQQVPQRALHELLPGPLNAGSTNFPSVTTLLFTCQAEGLPDFAGYLGKVKMFLRGLPKLTSLEMLGWDHSSLSLADALHPQLATLCLEPRDGTRPNATTLHSELEPREKSRPDAAEIARIVVQCPLVEDLSLHVARSKGDAAETAIYHAIGSFPNLKRLSLTLDVPAPRLTPNIDPHLAFDTTRRTMHGDDSDSDNEGNEVNSSPPIVPGRNPFVVYHVATRPVDPPGHKMQDHDSQDANPATLNEWYEQTAVGLEPWRNGDIHDLLINTAIDGALARAIFCAVSSKGADAPLRRLMVRTRCRFVVLSRDRFRTDHLQPFREALQGAWEVERFAPGGEKYEGKLRTRKLPLKRPRADWDDKTMLHHFRRVWPEKGATGNWWDDWNSWPLSAA